jgi:hypothetical protein
MRLTVPAIEALADRAASAGPDSEIVALTDESERRAGYVEPAEFEQVIRPGFRYVLEEAGMMNGKRLWSVFRQRVAKDEGQAR